MRVSFHSSIARLIFPLFRGAAEVALHCASSDHHPSKCSLQARLFSSLVRAPSWSTCGRRTRPFSGRAFREQGISTGFHPFHRARSASKKDTWPLFPTPPSLLVISQGWRLIDLPLRASNEGLPRPRVARAQKIIGLHPLSPLESSFSCGLFSRHGVPGFE
jgi:hypothetical protein